MKEDVHWGSGPLAAYRGGSEDTVPSRKDSDIVGTNPSTIRLSR